MRRIRSVSKIRRIIWNGLGWDGCVHFSMHPWKWWV